MGRLRTRTRYNKRSYESESKDPNKVFIIAVEGNETEAQYFCGLENNSKYLGIPSTVRIEVLDRYDTKSAPKYVVELLEEYIREGYTTTFIDKFKDTIENAGLGDTAENLIRKYFEDKISSETRKEMERLIYEADRDRIYYQYLETWNIDKKEFCVVFDRDKQSTKPWDFSQVVKDSIEKGYRVVITNPCFEFWLLLHVCDVQKEYSLDEIIQNRSVSRDKNFVDSKLSEILGGYNKSNIKFEEIFMNKIDIAIKREKEYATYWKDIINNVGSNVGSFIEDIRKR
ncbi:RloB family protein [Anaerosalibacter sp. Marseille-P3206]|uniref:RloB family protein n=1 Tax=Anaerosalibacter sp. Marseille-P3206 TaxID=1871005 RepID=UPI0009857E54|nr:RloB family protein [Anaerosalibacter sp. Marseille-P3206]